RGSTRCPRGYRRRGRKCLRTVRSCPLNYRRRGRRCVKRCASGRVPRRIRRGVIRCVVVTSKCPLGYSLRRVRRGRRYRFRCVINAGRCARGFRRVKRYRRGFSCVRIVCPRHYRKRGSRCVYRPPKGGSRRCPAGYKKVRGVCKKLNCPAGYVRRGSRCVHTRCPRFYRRVGRFCARIRFVGKCPRGWRRTGRLCRRRVCPSGFKKVGRYCMRKSCPSGFVRRGRACYRARCARGFKKMGSVCIRRCPSGTRTTRYFCIRKRCPKFFRRVGQSCVRARCPSGYVARSYRTRVYLKHRVTGYTKKCTCINGKSSAKPRANSIDVAFVVDVSGSMGRVISAIKKNIVNVINVNAKSRVVDKFILVPFADPKVGPVTISRGRSRLHKSRLIKAVRRMRASGGGDCPEMSQSGMYEALRRVKRNSIVYVFTDASPSRRDKRRQADVLRLSKSKNVQLNFLLTGPMCGKRNSYKNLSKKSKGAWIKMKKVDNAPRFALPQQGHPQGRHRSEDAEPARTILIHQSKENMHLPPHCQNEGPLQVRQLGQMLCQASAKHWPLLQNPEPAKATKTRSPALPASHENWQAVSAAKKRQAIPGSQKATASDCKKPETLLQKQNKKFVQKGQMRTG
ncbi:hypothetical protein BOX15_Mlig000911g8, partial [Macrostomum lignano]